MLGTVLGVLKIIGIVLLSIIGFVLLLVILLLALPVRYSLGGKSIEGEEKVKITGKVTVSWLLHLVHASLTYEEELNLVIRVFGIPVYDRNKKNKKSSDSESKKKTDASKKDESAKESGKETELESGFESEREVEEQIETTIEQDSMDEYEPYEPDELEESDSTEYTSKEDQHEGGSESQKKKFSLEEILDKFSSQIQKIPKSVEELIKKIEQKIDSIVETIKYYDKLLHSKGAKYVYELLWKELKKLLLHLKPRKCKGYIDYQVDDPEKCAKYFQYYGYLLPILPKGLSINLGYGEPVFRFDIIAKGRLVLGYVAIHILRVVLDKRVKLFKKKLKREDQ